MSTDQVSLFLALLALLAQVSAVGLATRLAHARRPDATWTAAVGRAVGPAALWFAGAVAIVSMLGSLYYSEIADFPPCRLCWFQRIGMYPLAVLLPIAAWLRDWGVRWYALPLAIGGGLTSAYHVAVQRLSLESGACEVANPCSTIWVEELGYLTIPAMALSGFALIVALLLMGPPTPEESS
ncbi:MAG TPA: disulfide bond formation protein B [Acidimicrobiales bacterium]|jgi:disulfide bond formation protein DsbB|nr:disulfide bond formation protein B [Acidimicrobiales bacterium]